MSVTRLLKRNDIDRLIESILNDQELQEIYENSEDFLRGNDSKEINYVVSNLKLIFANIKEGAFEKLYEKDFVTPSVYFLINSFYKEEKENTSSNEVYSLTLSFRARMQSGENIKIKKNLVFTDTFLEDFKTCVKELFTLIVEQVVTEYNIKVLNRTIVAGTHLYYDLENEVNSMDIDSMNAVFEDYEQGLIDLENHGIVRTKLELGNTPIVDISKGEITFGVVKDTIINGLEDSTLTIVSDFIYNLSQYNKGLRAVEERRLELTAKLNELKTKENLPKDEDKSSLSEAFFGLGDLFGEEDKEQDEKAKLEQDLEGLDRLIGKLEYEINIKFMGVRSRTETLFSKIISSEDTISLLSYYPEGIMELVATQPTSIRTKRIAPLLKDSFYEDEEYFKTRVDNGILFTYTDGVRKRTPLGLIVVPENAFRGKLIKKVNGVETSIGLDDFFMSKMAKIAKILKD